MGHGRIWGAGDADAPFTTPTGMRTLLLAFSTISILRIFLAPLSLYLKTMRKKCKPEESGSLVKFLFKKIQKRSFLNLKFFFLWFTLFHKINTIRANWFKRFILSLGSVSLHRSLTPKKYFKKQRFFNFFSSNFFVVKGDSIITAKKICNNC